MVTTSCMAPVGVAPPQCGMPRAVTTDQGELVEVVADSSPSGVWLRRAVVDDYGNEVMPNRI
jgi:hypothetical protein